MEVPKKAKVARARKGSSPRPGAADKSEASSASASVSASILVTFPADLRISSAATIHAELSGTPADRTLVIDASEVAKVDAAGLQAVLMALLRRRPSATWSWSATSEPFNRAVRVLGLQDAMALSSK